MVGKKFESITLDAVFSGLRFTDEWCSAQIADPERGTTLTLRFDRAFRECVVYTAPHREAICIEPYTCVPGAFDLHPRGIDAGLRILGPGESFNATVEMRLD